MDHIGHASMMHIKYNSSRRKKKGRDTGDGYSINVKATKLDAAVSATEAFTAMDLRRTCPKYSCVDVCGRRLMRESTVTMMRTTTKAG